MSDEDTHKVIIELTVTQLRLLLEALGDLDPARSSDWKQAVWIKDQLQASLERCETLLAEKRAVRTLN